MPAASAIPIWIIRHHGNGDDLQTYRVESEEVVVPREPIIGSEYYEPHVVTIEGSE